jgi:hypothetical protein
MRVLRMNFQQQIGQQNSARCTALSRPGVAHPVARCGWLQMTTTSQPDRMLRSARDPRAVAGQDFDDHRIGGYQSS